MLKIDKMFTKLRGAKVFTTLNLRSGYYHISLSERVKPKTAFVTPHSKWQFNMVPFGLAQALSYFQQLMNQVLQGLYFAIAYLDDIVIFSKNELEHLQHLGNSFQETGYCQLEVETVKI